MPSIEYGIFSDEGNIERQFYSAADASHAIDTRYHADDDLYVAEMCGCGAGNCDAEQGFCENDGEEDL